jgi:hypothetical protein
MKPRAFRLQALFGRGSDRSDLRADPAGFRRSRTFVGFGLGPIQLMIGLIDFGPKNRDLFRCLDSYLYSVTINTSDFDMDRITDHDTLIYLSG